MGAQRPELADTRLAAPGDLYAGADVHAAGSDGSFQPWGGSYRKWLGNGGSAAAASAVLRMRQDAIKGKIVPAKGRGLDDHAARTGDD
jgi:hypothetical protein